MKYTLGLDVGVASVGWAVLDNERNRIHDIGVRIFEKAEQPKDGKPLNAPRREARGSRRRLKRRRQRLNTLKEFFITNNLLDRKKIEEILSPTSVYNKLDLYALRARALDQEISKEELFKVLYQLSKRRGFKSNRKIEEASDKEMGSVNKAISINEQYLKDYKFRTVGEALYKDKNKFKEHKRNKKDDYSNSFARQDYINELLLIIKNQKKYSLKNISNEVLNLLIYGLDGNEVVEVNAIMYQRPFMTTALMEKMVGKCTFENDEKRAPKASYSFEMFKFINNLNNLEYSLKNPTSSKPQKVKLNIDQIQKITEFAKSTKTITYKKVQQISGISDDYFATFVRGKIKNGDPYGQTNTFGSLKAYHDIKSGLKDYPKDWQIIDNENSINNIASILTTNKTDEDIIKALENINISARAKQAILKIKQTNFKAFAHLSIKALQKITPHILQGKTYDQACQEAGYSFNVKSVNLETITNPVVRRAISQTLKVISAVTAKYGEPYYIHIETARELAKDFQERNKILKEQEENQENNKKLLEQLKDFGITSPTGNQIVKFKLYLEQNGICLYSGNKIDLQTMLKDDNSHQIDHIIPFSRSGNDSLANKTLVTTAENQLKGNKTPYESFGANTLKWNRFVKTVETIYATKSVKEADKDQKKLTFKSNNYFFKKKNNLLNPNFTNTEWNIRAINDTRYINKFLQSAIKQQIKFTEGPEKQRVISPAGTITSYMRKRWGLNKNREVNVLHHAADAAIVAAIDQKMIYMASLFAKKNEIKTALANAKTIKEKTDLITGEITDIEAFRKATTELEVHKLLTEKYFPEPWDRFSEEVDWRTRDITAKDLKDKAKSFANYDPDFIKYIKPILVSRMRLKKKSGEAHKATLRSPKVYNNNMRSLKTPLTEINLEKLENTLIKESDPQLYSSIKQRLLENSNNPAKAFIEPIYKYNKKGQPVHQVKSVKVLSAQPSGFYINNNKAFVNNGSMVRLDIYSKKVNNSIEHYFVPIYVHQLAQERKGKQITTILPNKGKYKKVDSSFTKVCNIYPNDYIQIKLNGKVMEGYYVKYNISSGVMAILNHSSSSKKYIIEISPRQASSIKKKGVDILGNKH